MTKKTIPLEFWKTPQVLPSSTTFKLRDASTFDFSVDEKGGWSFHPHKSVFVTETNIGPCPLQFNEEGRPYFQPQWALNLAIADQKVKEIGTLIERGAPLTSTFSKLLGGVSAYISLLSRGDKSLSLSKLNSAFVKALDRGEYSETNLKNMLDHALMYKRLGVADLVWTCLEKKQIKLTDDDAQSTLMRLFSPTHRFDVAFEERQKDTLSPFSISDYEEEWMIQMTSTWCDRLIGDRIFQEAMTNSVVVQSPSTSSSSETSADITFDIYGSLLFHHPNYFERWRKKMIQRFDAHIPISEISWDCVSKGPRMSQYPSGKWSTIEVIRWLHEEEKAAEIEKRALQSLPQTTSTAKPARL